MGDELLSATSILESARMADIDAAREYLKRTTRSSPVKGLLVVSVAAGSLTANWQVTRSMPTVVLTATDFQREWRINLKPYLESRLHGILVEVDAAEETRAALTSVDTKRIQKAVGNVRLGLMMHRPPENPSATSDYPYTVGPSDPMAALDAFQTK